MNHRSNCPRGACIPWICVSDFVVKESRNAFNQLPDDHGLEHINRIGKFAGGLVGITRSVLHAVYQLNDCASRKCGWW